MVRRAGFSLVEVLVSLVLLGVGALALAATAEWAGRLREQARRVELAGVLASAVLDSVFQVGGAGAGERVEPGVRLRWTATETDGLLRIELRFVEPALLRGTTAVLLRAPTPAAADPAYATPAGP